MSDARRGGKTYRDNWIRQLLDGGHAPSMQILEETDEENASEREKWWIAEMRRRGEPLTNLTDGGDHAFRVSEEARAKIRQAKLGQKVSEQARAKISAAARGNKKWEGRKHTEETKKKIGAASKARGGFSKQCREAARAAAIGNKHTLGYKHTEQSRRKMSQNSACKGKPISENHRRGIIEASRRRRRLSPDQIREIRTLASSGLSQSKIAKRFGVCRAQIGYIVNRKLYADVD
jgi:hypothetical protein